MSAWILPSALALFALALLWLTARIAWQRGRISGLAAADEVIRRRREPSTFQPVFLHRPQHLPKSTNLTESEITREPLK